MSTFAFDIDDMNHNFFFNIHIYLDGNDPFYDPRFVDVFYTMRWDPATNMPFYLGFLKSVIR